MHEIHLMKDLLNKIDGIINQQKASKATAISVWLGALSHISASHFTEHFVEESLGRSCEGAKLEIEESTDISHPQAQDVILRSVDVQ